VGSGSAERDLGFLADNKPTTRPCGKEAQQHLGLHEEHCWQVSEVILPLSTDQSLSAVLGPVLGSPAQETYRLCGASPEKGH